MANKTELWKTIPQFPDYAVSNMGRVKRVVSRPYHPAKLLNPWLHTTGCLCVSLHKDGKRRSVRVHILVAEAFLPNLNGLPTVNHKDGDKTRNVVDNLEWASSQRQIIHAIQTGLHKTKGYSIFRATGRWEAYIQINGRKIHLGFFPTESVAKAARQTAEKIHHRLELIP
jgi:hypothetical protein